MLSIVIPTLNEEEYLPQLLKSIKRQKFLDCEIIVADAGSKDKTVKIAEDYGCIVVKGGLPAKGRNSGAKVAKGGILFFLDADTVLPNNFFKKSLKEFNSRKLDIAGFCFSFTSKYNFAHPILDFYNKSVAALEGKMPFSVIGVLIKKNLFKKINGYNETLKLSEDRDMGRRATKYGKFGIIRSTKIFISDRRYKKDGWIATATKHILSELHVSFIGPIKSDIFKYKFGHYNDKNSK